MLAGIYSRSSTTALQHVAQYPRRCERDARLADLRRLAAALIHRARGLYANEPFAVDLAQTAYAFDATTIDLCLALFPSAARRAKGKRGGAHTLLDLRGHPDVRGHHRWQSRRCDAPRCAGDQPARSTFSTAATPTSAAVCDHRGAGLLRDPREARARLCAARLAAGRQIHPAAQRPDHRALRPQDGHVLPAPFRRVTYVNHDTQRRFMSLTNNFTLPATPDHQLYKYGGRSSCSSSGSSSTCGSRRSTAPR